MQLKINLDWKILANSYDSYIWPLENPRFRQSCAWGQCYGMVSSLVVMIYWPVANYCNGIPLDGMI